VAYADLNTIHNPSTGVAPPAAWGDQARDNFEYFNTMLPQGQGAWTVFSAVTVTQSISVSRNIVYCRYHKNGRNVRFQAYLGLTTSGTANQPLVISLPFTAAQSGLAVGTMYWYDASAALNYLVPASLYSTTQVGALISGTASYLGQTVAGYPNQTANLDSLLVDCSYESTT
jgi:hypothetical protein